MTGSAGTKARAVVVLMGGASAERDVSLSSGRECAKALRQAGHRVDEIEIPQTPGFGADLARQIMQLDADVVFNALHGRWGEDGCVQGLLEWLGVPYTHSGVLASALAMDKSRAKEQFRAAGIPVAQSCLVTLDRLCEGHIMPPPYVIKPNDEGSSVGIKIITSGDLALSPAELDDTSRVVMVESYVPGRELTVTVMGARPLGVTEIITTGWYDYQAKYVAGGSRHILPADIPEAVAQACCDYAVKAARSLGCRGISRADFRWDDSKGLGGLILLELNTQPGMTPTSLAPEQAAYAGIDFQSLVSWMVEDALCQTG